MPVQRACTADAGDVAPGERADDAKSNCARGGPPSVDPGGRCREHARILIRPEGVENDFFRSIFVNEERC